MLLIGTGKTSKRRENAVRKYIAEADPVVITVNRIDEDIKEDMIFLCNSKRYLQLSSQLSRESHAIIATSNLTKTGKNEFDYVINYESLLEKAPIVADSAVIMLMKLLAKSGCKEIAMAGLDGYTNAVAVEFSKEKGADTIVNISDYINNYIRNVMMSIKNKKLRFITKSKYEF